MAQKMITRTGGHLVVEALEALDADVAFGLPGIHTLATWEALRMSSIRLVGLRTELSTGFAADGYARVSGRPAPLLLSTGPGALMSLAALMEAASSHVPVVAIASAGARDLIGKHRGYSHELDDQIASFTPVVKWSARAQSAEEIPALLAEAWQRAQTAPSGPVFVEVPVDLLRAETELPRVDELDGAAAALPVPDEASLQEAARRLAAAEKPVIWAGGGVLRSGAWDELLALAERLRIPVATTFMGKSAFPEDHPLSAGSACDGALTAFLEDSDAVLAVGTQLGAAITREWTMRLPDTLIHIDASPQHIGASYAPAIGIVADARAALAGLTALVPERAPDGRAEARVAALRARLQEDLTEQGVELETGLMQTIREALPPDGINFWDMTILAYAAVAYYPALTPRSFHFPDGSGTLGHAWPAALGARLALPETPVLAVVGDGGIHYGLTELATARQHGIGATLLIVDDSGYGILREFQHDAYGETNAVDLAQPDFVQAVEAFGVPVRATTPDALAGDLDWALGSESPSVLVLSERLRWVR